MWNTASPRAASPSRSRTSSTASTARTTTRKGPKGSRKGTAPGADLHGAALEKEIKRVEKDMLAAARNLEFETAAQLRDQLRGLRERMLAE